MSTIQTTNTAATPTAPRLDADTAVLVVSDDSGDSGIAAAVAVATEIAAAASVPVIVYDRSHETWVDTPHPVGPIDMTSDEVAERPHLRSQMERIAEQGVAPEAWLATLPSIANITSAIVGTQADVVVAAWSSKRKILERSLVGDSIPATISEMIGRHRGVDATVVAVSDDGRAEVVRRASVDGTSDPASSAELDTARGATTLPDVLHDAEAEGFTAQRGAMDDGQVRCGECNDVLDR